MSRSVVDSVARPVVIDRVVYGTIAIASVLIVYDGWGTLRLRDALAIIAGPILAMFISHVFSANLAQHADLGRRPTRHEWLRTVGFESRFLLLAVPPLVLLIVVDLAGLALSDAVRVVIWAESLSIGFWAGLAARRAGFVGWTLVFAVCAGLVVGGAVLVLQVLLQPGTATRG